MHSYHPLLPIPKLVIADSIIVYFRPIHKVAIELKKSCATHGAQAAEPSDAVNPLVLCFGRGDDLKGRGAPESKLDVSNPFQFWRLIRPRYACQLECPISGRVRARPI